MTIHLDKKSPHCREVVVSGVFTVFQKKNYYSENKRYRLTLCMCLMFEDCLPPKMKKSEIQIVNPQ